MITYALSITTFSELQLNEIQKKIIYLLLPKLGLNRNTPRAVIYGPACRGGRSILDLRLEQPSKHYKTNMGHIRRGDQAGSALLTTLHDTQLESGRKTLSTHIAKKVWNILPKIPDGDTCGRSAKDII